MEPKNNQVSMQQPKQQPTLNVRLNETLHTPDGTQTKPRKLPTACAVDLPLRIR